MGTSLGFKHWVSGAYHQQVKGLTERQFKHWKGKYRKQSLKIVSGSDCWLGALFDEKQCVSPTGVGNADKRSVSGLFFNRKYAHSMLILNNYLVYLSWANNFQLCLSNWPAALPACLSTRNASFLPSFLPSWNACLITGMRLLLPERNSSLSQLLFFRLSKTAPCNAECGMWNA